MTFNDILIRSNSVFKNHKAGKADFVFAFQVCRIEGDKA